MELYLLKSAVNFNDRIESLSESYNLYKLYSDNNKDVWLQYYFADKGDGTFDSEKFNRSNVCYVPSTYIWIPNGDNYDIYEYNGALKINREIKNGVINDIIVNRQDIIAEVKDYIKNNCL